MPADSFPAERLTRSRPAPPVGIVHLGLGAFFRAHGALYVAEAMAASGGDWGIAGVSLRSPAIRDALAPQGGAYTLLELGPEGETARVIEAVAELLVAPEDPEAVLARLADPAVRIVTLTVTEKGYCHSPATGRLDPSHPDILHDLANPLPRSAPGFLVRALARRRAQDPAAPRTGCLESSRCTSTSSASAAPSWVVWPRWPSRPGTASPVVTPPSIRP